MNYWRRTLADLAAEPRSAVGDDHPRLRRDQHRGHGQTQPVGGPAHHRRLDTGQDVDLAPGRNGLGPVGSTSFDSERTGLDHVSFAVASRGELESAAAALTAAGIKHGEIVDLTDAGLAILSFQEPDDINIELTAPLG